MLKLFFGGRGGRRAGRVSFGLILVVGGLSIVLNIHVYRYCLRNVDWGVEYIEGCDTLWRNWGINSNWIEPVMREDSHHPPSPNEAYAYQDEEGAEAGSWLNIYHEAMFCAR